MIYEAGQVAAEAAKSGSILSGQFILDGAFLIALLKIVEAGIRWATNKVKARSEPAPSVVPAVLPANGKGPKPGESDTCREHGENIATLLEFKKSAEASLTRIETKVDRILERK